MRRGPILATLSCLCVAVACWLLVTYCQASPTTFTPISSDVVLGVIETRQGLARSRLVLYDEQLNEVQEVGLNYATLGMNWNLSQVRDGRLYTIPCGYVGKLNEHKALVIDLLEGKVEAYPIDRNNLYGLCLGEAGCFYTCGSINGAPYILKLQEGAGVLTEAEEADAYIQSICYAEGRLYTFAVQSNPDGTEAGSWLGVYDEDLSLLEKVDISSYGTGQYRPVASGDEILFASWSGTDGTGDSRTLGVYHRNSGQLEMLEFDEPVLEALPYGDKMLLIFGSIHEGQSTAALYDPSTWEQPGEQVPLGMGVWQRLVIGDTLYVVGDERQLAAFDLANGFALKTSCEIGHIDADFSYISGLFDARA